MGIQYGYDEIKHKWYIKGWGLYKEYNAESEMKADISRMSDKHFQNIRSFSIVTRMLLSYR